jgi:hypothetical protein
VSHSRSQRFLVMPGRMPRRRHALMALLGCFVLGAPLLWSRPASAMPGPGHCGHALIKTAESRLELYFRTRHTGCALAKRVVRQYFRRVPGECSGSGCFISLPSRWRCHVAPGAVTEDDGPVAQCSRKHGYQRILTSRFADRGFEPDRLVRRGSGARSRLPTLNDGERFAVRPATLGGWTFDARQVFGGPSEDPPHGHFAGGSFGTITWTSWTGSAATGEGVVWTDDCEPSCAEGEWLPSPTLVTAYRPRRDTFQRMRFTCDCEEPAVTRARLRLKGDLPPQWEIVRQW